MTATTERRYVWMFAILAAVGFAADQASKYVVFAKLYPDHPMQQTTTWHLIPNWFALQTHYMDKEDTGDDALSFLRTVSGQRLPYVNKGALFGFGNGHEGGWNNVFMGISIAAAFFIVFWVRRPNVACDRFLCFALGLILAGTLGNLYDRVVFSGVRDFLHAYYVDVDGMAHIWPDFNVADCCLVCGAGALLVHSFFAKDPTTEPAKTELAAAQAEAPAASSSAIVDIESVDMPLLDHFHPPLSDERHRSLFIPRGPARSWPISIRRLAAGYFCGSTGPSRWPRRSGRRIV